MIAIKGLADTAAIPVNTVLIEIIAEMNDSIEIRCIGNVAVHMKAAKGIIRTGDDCEFHRRVAACGGRLRPSKRRDDIA